MKRLIAAALTATTMMLAACTATTGRDPSASAIPSITAPTSTAPTATGTSTSEPVSSWLFGTTSTSSAPTSTSTTSAAGSSTSLTTGDMYDAIPVTIPSTITGAGLKSANAAIPVWRNAMRVFDESLQDPSGKNWKTAVYRYVNDPAALQQMSLIDTLIRQGVRQIGDTGYSAEVLSATKHNVQIRACVDLSKYDVVDAGGNSVLEAGTPRRFSRTFSVSFYYNNDPKMWFLNDIKTPNPVEPC